MTLVKSAQSPCRCGLVLAKWGIYYVVDQVNLLLGYFRDGLLYRFTQRHDTGLRISESVGPASGLSLS